MSTETGVETETQTETETETETETVTKTAGACAMGAGALAITCKTMVLGFFAAGFTLAGLSGVSPLLLMIGVVVLGSIFMYKGFGWAGRRPVALGISAIVFMFLGYVAAGYFITSGTRGGSRTFLGSVKFGMWPAGDVATNAIYLVIPATLYLIGTGLFFAAVYDSYIRELNVFDSTGAMGAGILGLSVCGGCGLTGVAGAGMVVSTGVVSNDMKFVGADALMSLLVVGIIGYTVYKRAWPQTILAVVGSLFAFFLTWNLFGFPHPDGFLGMMGITLEKTAKLWLGGMMTQEQALSVAEIFETMFFTWFGLGMMFFAAMWAAYPGLSPVPDQWKNRIPGREPGAA